MKRLGHGRETAHGNLVIGRGTGAWSLAFESLFFVWNKLVRLCMKGAVKPREAYTRKYSRYLLIFFLSCWFCLFSDAALFARDGFDSVCLSLRAANDDVTRRHMGTAISNNNDNSDEPRLLCGHCPCQMFKSNVIIGLQTWNELSI
jgi:hypothetical protein